MHEIRFKHNKSVIQIYKRNDNDNNTKNEHKKHSPQNIKHTTS